MLVGALRVTVGHSDAACVSCAYQCFNPIASFERKTAGVHSVQCMSIVYITYG